MRQGADRYEVHACFGVFAQRVERDAAARLRFAASGDLRDGLPRQFRGEIVEHDAVHASCGEHFVDVFERTHFAFDRNVLAFCLEIGFGSFDGRADAACKVYVVVLQQNHVEQSHAVILTAADLDGHLVQLFVYTIVVAQMEHFSGWAGVIALALLQVPIVIRTTENMLKLVPYSLREAAYALGTPKWKMISAITLKASVSGIMTGILLAIARIAGETAPLLFTALSNQFWSTDMMQPIANLPVTIFKFAMSPFAEWQQLAWAGVLIITLCVLLLNILARVVFAKNKHG